MKSIPELETERLLLRGFQTSDKHVLQQLCNDKEIASKTLSISYPFNMEDAEAWIQKKFDNFENDEEIAWAICHLENGDLMGAVGLKKDLYNDSAEIGFWMGELYRGKGYVTEASIGVVEFAFYKMNLNRVEAKHMVGNEASGKVLQKIGMKFEGMHRQQVKKWDEFKDVKSYAVIKSDFF